MNVLKPVVGVAALALATGIALPTMAGSGNKYASTESVRDCGSGDTVTLVGPLKLWPPNHKFVDEPVTARDGDGTSNVTISVYPTITDAEGGDGGPQHDPDANASQSAPLTDSGAGSATAALQLRAERSGKGEGRTYDINWTATFDNGSKTCASGTGGQTPFTVTVPHDMRGGADWKATKP
ncbi:MAG: hypothetical protein QOJ03_132 [Frankiaceae bacterium]|nr:hypothetical protein [Frankiaceae bacterium]